MAMLGSPEASRPVSLSARTLFAPDAPGQAFWTWAVFLVLLGLLVVSRLTAAHPSLGSSTNAPRAASAVPASLLPASSSWQPPLAPLI